jgi:ferritin-like metal-binding protein YciE
MTAAFVVDLAGLLVLELEKLLAVEQRLVALLPRLAAEATDVQLQKGIERHAAETREHAKNLEAALRALGAEPGESPTPELQGLELGYRAEVERMSTAAPGELGDLALTRNGAAFEHLEIAGYESALQKAELLGLDAIVELLEGNLDDERRMLDEGESVSHRLASALAREHLRA